MPLVYADTSALFAYFHPRDEFSKAVANAVRESYPDFIYWSFSRFEIRHALRQANTDSHGATAWKALRAAEKTSSRLRWYSEITADKMIDAAEELSADKGAGIGCGGMDVIHVAAARRVNLFNGLDQFWTCDATQAKLAKESGLKVRLFELKHPSGE